MLTPPIRLHCFFSPSFGEPPNQPVLPSYRVDEKTIFPSFWGRPVSEGELLVLVGYTLKCVDLLPAKKHLSIYIIHDGPPKPTILEVFMVNHLVFRWTKPVCSVVLGAHGIYHKILTQARLAHFWQIWRPRRKTTDPHKNMICPTVASYKTIYSTLRCG